ncbi:uncharacterized protein [Periplaneta americana]|uniref:uncharacterized protein isoform X2 n=1 Tax=Periplaneta americana TaxID=6978 RepID=UPI0037E730F8
MEQLERITYSKLPGHVNLNAPMYEMDVALFLFLRGINDGRPFILASNMKAAGQFDDVVFKHIDSNGSKVHFIQVKHKDNSRYIIRPETLSGSKGEFSILKYFKSFCDIRKNCVDHKDLKVLGDFDNFEFVIFTNAGVNKQFTCDEKATLTSIGSSISFHEHSNKNIVHQTFEEWKRFQEFFRDVNDEDIPEKIREFKKKVTVREIIQELESKNVKDLEEKFGDFSFFEEYLNKLKLYSKQVITEKSIKEQIEIACEASSAGVDTIYEKCRFAMREWWEKCNFHLNESAIFWRKIRDDFLSAAKKISESKVELFEELNIVFSDSAVSSMQIAVESGQVVHISPRGSETILSTLKVYQAVKSSQLQTFIITDLDNLISKQEEILKCWETKWCTYLIIEQCQQTSSDVRNLCKNVIDVLNRRASKKIVLVAPQSSTVASELATGTTLQVVPLQDSCTFNDFNQETQNFLLKTEINFQGKSVSLGSFLHTGDNLKMAINNDLVCKLIKKQQIEIGKALTEKIDFYVQRTLIRYIYVDNYKELTRCQTHDHVFAISGMSHSELRNLVLPYDKIIPVVEWPFLFQKLDPTHSNVIEFKDYDKEGSFQKLSESYECIHWFHKEGERLVWKASKGDMTPVYEHIDTIIWRKYEPKKLTDIDDKVVVIVATPGMGKTTLLTHLAAEMKDCDPSCWIVRVDLNDHSKFLYSIKNNIDTELCIDIILEFLWKDVLKLGNGISSEFEHKLFEQSLKEGKVYIMFDGYDEISPSYAEVVSIMLKKLQEFNVGKLWVTTRPVMRKRLEKTLSTIPFSFQPIRCADQISLLQQVWKKKYPDIRQDVLKNFVTELLQITASSLSDKEKELTGIPLQTNMLAEVFEPELYNCYKTGKIPLPKTLNVLQLYKKFINKKIDIYYKEKKKTDLTNGFEQDVYDMFRKIFMENHTACGIVSVIPKEKLKDLQGFQSPDKSFLKKVENGSEKTGVIDDITDGKPHFTHKTFAEYFTARWFSKHYSRNREMVMDIISAPCYNVVKIIFDRVLARGSALHMAVLDSDRDRVEQAINATENINTLDKGGRTALHLAVSLKNGQKDSEDSESFSSFIYTDTEGTTSEHHITQLLLERNASVNIKDKVLCWTPLQYTDRLNGNFRLVGMLLQYGANPRDISKSKMMLIKNNVEENIKVAIKQGYIELITWMIEFGFDVNLKLPCDNCRISNRYSTVFHESILCEQLEVARILIDNGANVDMRDCEGNTALHLAAKEGKLQAVTFLLKNKSDFNLLNENRDTPLHVATRSGKLEVVQCLVESGASIISGDKDATGRTALHVAANQNNLDIVKYLYENGGHKVCNRSCIIQETPLHIAASYGRYNNVKFLAERAIHVDVADNKGNTALHNALVFGKSVDVIKCLVEAGANIYKENNRGETALHLAADSNKMEILNYFAEKRANFNIQNKRGITPLHRVAEEGNMTVIRYLMERCSNIDTQDKDGDSSLLYAARKGNTEVVNYLIETAGVMVSVCNRSGNNALHCAAESGNLELVKYLLKKYRYLNRSNGHGETPLLTAALHKNWEVVKFLGRNKANLHAKRPDGITLLHIAAEQNNVDIVSMLLRKRFNVNLKTITGNTPLHIACQYGSVNVVKYLTNSDRNSTILNNPSKLTMNNEVTYDININLQNNDGRTALHVAVANRRLDIVEHLVDNGADVNLQDRQCLTPLCLALTLNSKDKKETNTIRNGKHLKGLEKEMTMVENLVSYLLKARTNNESMNAAMHMAVWQGKWGLVPLLVNAGADVNACYIYGLTALHKAAASGEYHVAEYLLQRKADVNKKDIHCITPLLYAAFSGYCSMIDLLVLHGARLKHKDKMGNTALHCATSSGHREAVKCLLGHGDVSLLRIKNGVKKTALDVAKVKQHHLVVEYLKSVTAQRTRIKSASFKGKGEIRERGNSSQKNQICGASNSKLKQRTKGTTKQKGRALHDKTNKLF